MSWNDQLRACSEQDYLPFDCDSLPPRGRLLVLAPHPDDEVLGCSAIISQGPAQGQSVEVLVLTDGSKAIGHADDAARHQYVRRRQQESIAAAEVLGCPPPDFLGYEDRSLAAVNDLPEILQLEIARRQATVVAAPSLHEIHPDHRATALAAVHACRSSAVSHLVFYEVGVPQWPNLLLDLTPMLEQKQRAIECFASQLELHNYADHIMGLNRFRSYTLAREVAAAEAYRVVHQRQLADWDALYGRCPLADHLARAGQD